MTAVEQTDPVRAFREALGGTVRHQLHDTQRVTVLVHRAVNTHGWTAKTLAAECMRDHNGAINPAGIVMHRLGWAAENAPAGQKSARAVPFCSAECRDNSGLILDPDTLLPTGKCSCRTPQEVA